MLKEVRSIGTSENERGWPAPSLPDMEGPPLVVVQGYYVAEIIHETCVGDSTISAWGWTAPDGNWTPRPEALTDVPRVYARPDPKPAEKQLLRSAVGHGFGRDKGGRGEGSRGGGKS